MIEKIAIAYGDARNGRSCANCNYLDNKIMGVECGLHCLPTKLSKVCGTWIDERVKVKQEEQGGLF